MKVLVLGASGMIGSAMLRVLSEKLEWQVFGTVRSEQSRKMLAPAIAPKLICNVDIHRYDSVLGAFASVQPHVVVNCIGLTKHHAESADPLMAIPANALLPHRLAELCRLSRSRLVHVSTDCVFSGVKGSYEELDRPDSVDLYGQTKAIGETHYSHAVTLRTSTIGHELQSAYGLLEWFLAQTGSCTGFGKAIFSGLPSNVFAQIVRDVVIPRQDLSGLYHVGAQAISKYDLLRLIAGIYGKTIDIIRNDDFVIDRSLNSTRFTQATGYVAPPWPTLIQMMQTSR